MNKYELLYIIDNDVAPASVPAEITRLGRIVDEIVRLMIVRK